MNTLEAEGFVVLGGPLRDGALLIVEAETVEAVRARLASDHWERSALLVLASAEPWEVLLGGLQPRPPVSV